MIALFIISIWFIALHYHVVNATIQLFASSEFKQDWNQTIKDKNILLQSLFFIVFYLTVVYYTHYHAISYLWNSMTQWYKNPKKLPIIVISIKK